MENSAFEILMVEDSEDDIELMLHALRRENLGGHIQVVRDGEAAIQFLADREAELVHGNALPHLIMIDLTLPKVDGLEVLRRIRNNPRMQAIPVVIVTDSTKDADMDEAYNLGANGYLQKPADSKEFETMVNQVVLYWLLVNQLPTASQKCA